MLPKNNRKVTAEEALEQCRRNRQEARILEGRDRPYAVESQISSFYVFRARLDIL